MLKEIVKNIFSSPNAAKKRVKLPSGSTMKGFFGTTQNPLKVKIKQQLLKTLNDKAPIPPPQHKEGLISSSNYPKGLPHD